MKSASDLLLHLTVETTGVRAGWRTNSQQTGVTPSNWQYQTVSHNTFHSKWILYSPLKAVLVHLYLNVNIHFMFWLCWIYLILYHSMFSLWKITFQQKSPFLSSLCLHCGWMMETQSLWTVRLNIHLQDGGSSGIRLFPNHQTATTALSCCLTAAMGLNRIPTLFMDRLAQHDMCAELEEETQCITLSTVNLRLSGLEVSLFPSVLNASSVCDQHTVSWKLTLMSTNNCLCTFMILQMKKWIDCGDFLIFNLWPASSQTFTEWFSKMDYVFKI